jgi:hypothetical protein
MRGIMSARRTALALSAVFVLGTGPSWAADPAAQAATPAQDQPSARKQEAPAVEVKVETGGDVEPVPSAPPAPVVPMERRPGPATVGPVRVRPMQAGATTGALVAVSFAENEATLQVNGARKVVRLGSRLGDDTVRSVVPGRIVLERPAAAGAQGGPAALVIVTFDESGRSREQVFWTVDPTRPVAPEVKKP